MPKTREQKEREVTALIELLRSAYSGALATLDKITVKDEWRLRQAMKDAGGTMKVVKKSLLKRALQELRMDSGRLGELTGTIAVAAGRDAFTVVKEAVRFAKATEAFRVVAGFMREGEAARILSGDEVKGLATLPSREDLIARAIESICAIVWFGECDSREYARAGASTYVNTKKKS